MHINALFIPTSKIHFYAVKAKMNIKHLSIRAHIGIYIAFTIFSGMSLVALASCIYFHNYSLLSFRKQNFNLWNIAVVNFVKRDVIAFEFNKEVAAQLFESVRGTGVNFVFLSDFENIKYFPSLDSTFKDKISTVVNNVRFTRTQEDVLLYSDNSLSKFLHPESLYYVTVFPVFYSGANLSGVAGAVWRLDSLNYEMTKGFKLVFIYVCINTIVLAAVCVYQIGNITAKPLQKILRKTELISSETFIPEARGSDFDKLSSSIGSIIDELSKHRKQLQKTIIELEISNKNLHKMQNEIIRAEKMASIGRLSAGLAHEIGNPVGIISGYLEMLKYNEVDDQDRIDYASRADDELKRIDFIIRELLDYARPSDQRKTELSVHQLINDIINAYAVSRAIGTIDLKAWFEAEFDSVIANYDQLRQVFMNLIINASDAIYDSENRDNGRLEISTANILDNEGNYSELIISFVDNGCGLSEKDLENVFDPFFTTKPRGKGTGLGLSVSLMIIDDIGGSIKAFPCDGCGTEFRIILPMTKAVVTV